MAIHTKKVYDFLSNKAVVKSAHLTIPYLLFMKMCYITTALQKDFLQISGSFSNF